MARARIDAIGASIAAALVLAVASVTFGAEGYPDDAIVACVGPDRVFRFGALDRPCAKGEQRYLLEPAEPDIKEPEVVNSDPPKPVMKVPSEMRVRALEERVQQLERELLRALELGAGATRVVAPFAVLDKKGRQILTVTEDPNPRLTMFNSAGKGQIYLSVLPEGGTVKGVSKDWSSEASVSYGGVTVRENDKIRAQIGRGAAQGNYALRLYSEKEAAIASIGLDKEGNGGIRIANAAGDVVSSVYVEKGEGRMYVLKNNSPVAGLAAEGDRGVVAVYNRLTPVASLSRSTAGDGGNVTVSLNNGKSVFSAGAAQDGAGEACVNRKTQAGTQRVACLGLGLPSAGMGK